MASIAAITANSTTMTQALNKAAKSSSLGMNADTFLQLFTTQISNQNPMEPMDSADFLNQFSQISQVQTMTEMQKSLDALKSTLSSLTTSSEQASAAEMLGRTVEYVDSTGAAKTGTVDAIAMQTSGEVHLMVNGTAIPVENVRKVSQTPAAPAAQ
jgi:flagellar basal-body rod modification protein FlgD